MTPSIAAVCPVENGVRMLYLVEEPTLVVGVVEGAH